MQELAKKIINFVLDQSSRPGAIYLLIGWSFVEAWFIIPVPPDALLIPMSITQPSKAYFYAYMTTISSVIGGLLGYLIGFFAIDFAMTYIESIGLMDAYAQATEWFTLWGSAVILIAGFTVIPFKIFTIMAGSMKMNVFLFLLASIVSRGARFFIVAYASKKGGQMAVDKIMDHADKLGYLFMALLMIGLIWSVL
ncbi:MAG: DedA family protein [Gammaproteobacteria bacterium]|jgi:membrane protein YqaA with SNARE-associated domain|nr:hypothetical protein [Gammaproteobacteria bacterium]MBQ08448.1 hypothetical protein [Gammaproteobacteria bacterium]MDP6146795.1 DedA family protein [Gammaproteobacteria bacterium]HJL80020.1 DedA family protein [Gammaproteobacteria bacterium]HJM09502.1 DedA family protein [Gammaproteobacteria bacterium]|tara:strand:- start:22264 stop:22848 length:585 start_codon:yes stop_codon:yes gene_type:complete